MLSIYNIIIVIIDYIKITKLDATYALKNVFIPLL